MREELFYSKTLFYVKNTIGVRLVLHIGLGTISNNSIQMLNPLYKLTNIKTDIFIINGFPEDSNDHGEVPKETE